MIHPVQPQTLLQRIGEWFVTFEEAMKMFWRRN